MGRVALVVLGGAFVVAGCSASKPQIARPDALHVAEPGARANPGEPLEGQAHEALLSVSRVHFGFDSATLPPATRELLAETADKLRHHQDVHLFVDGHADERGPTEYNIALSDRRAQAVSDYLTRLGVAAERLQPVPKGEEYPLAMGTGSHAWAENRRVDFRLTRGDVRFELRDGQPLDDQGMPIGARLASDDTTAINPVADR